ncbi:MAG: DUF1236 domain-containing protein [Methylocella sp.]
MRKSLLTTIAAAALIAGAGLAKAQQMPGSNRTNAQGYSEGQQGAANPAEHQPGAMQDQRRSAATQQTEHRGQAGAMERQRRSAAMEQREHRGQAGAMEKQRRSAVMEQREHRGRAGAMEKKQGRSAATEQRERRSGQAGAMQGEAQGRSAPEQNRGGITEQRSVASPTLSSGQKTRLHQIVAGGNIQRINHADFALSVGTVVPDTVALYDLPPTIVNIVPQYSGFEYIVVRNELVIIDPATLDIVAILPV